MKKFKGLIIPPRKERKERTENRLREKQQHYCDKTWCYDTVDHCIECLFEPSNVKIFGEWYMAKNKIKEGEK